MLPKDLVWLFEETTQSFTSNNTSWYCSCAECIKCQLILRDHIEESVVGATIDSCAAQCFVNVSEALSVRANKYLLETIEIFPTSWKC